MQGPYRLHKPPASTRFKPTEVSTEAGGTEYSVRVLRYLLIRQGFSDCDLMFIQHQR